MFLLFIQFLSQAAFRILRLNLVSAIKNDEDLIENVLRRATNVIPGLYDKPYKERLAAMKVPSMRYRKMQEI